MRIQSLEYDLLELKLAVPYQIAYETISSCENVILRLVTDSGFVGYGCAAPDWEVTGEKARDIMQQIEGPITRLLKGKDPFQQGRYMQAIRNTEGIGTSARAMVDMALYDLLARKAGLPLYKVLGGYRHQIPTSITIGILPLQETLELARKFIGQGFTILKLKGGISPEEDLEKVHKLRETLGNDFAIRFDANQGYTATEAIEFVKKSKGARIDILEQPTPVKHPEAMKEVSLNTFIPIMADESIKSLDDAYHFTRQGMMDMVNIKLQKVGGILEASHINSVAKAGGLEVMIGCMDESALGISAGLHFALSRPNIHFADLDGHLDLLGDPFTALFTIENGIMIPSDHPGLGPIS
ncbi:mandelate racemase/muconate lactonizing enzyme family protein [Robiginitalea sp. IMCC43444]|uniref:mandelate racemase/muconate lactonizing enzyme family protein n=1 Tax=Robiginitalea sp. IMCC43444 TaxID=3459121 RepID=UPI004043230D